MICCYYLAAKALYGAMAVTIQVYIHTCMWACYTHKQLRIAKAVNVQMAVVGSNGCNAAFML